MNAWRVEAPSHRMVRGKKGKKGEKKKSGGKTRCEWMWPKLLPLLLKNFRSAFALAEPTPITDNHVRHQADIEEASTDF